MLTIRRKIVLGCLALTAVTVLFGAFAQTAQRDLGAVATRLYDEAFLAMSCLRSAQNGLMRAEAEYRRPVVPDAPAPDAPASDAPASDAPGPDTSAPDGAARVALAAALDDIEADLQAAAERAMSPDGIASVERLRARLSELAAASGAGRGAVLAAMPPAAAAFDTAVEVYAADGYRHRQEAERMVERAALRNRVAVAVSVAAALAITVLLSRSIVPALREAVGLAQAIAAGRLDDPIRARGRDETGQLLGALGIMQASIAAALARIRALMDEQASSHAGQIAAQHARLDAALSNMSQGLCLFGPDGRLLVANRRFAEMFGTAPQAGAEPADVFAGGGLSALLAPERPGARTHDEARAEHPGGRAGDEAAFSCDLPDGRSIAVAHRPVAGGGRVGTYEDVTERHRADARLAHTARHDALTGLPNRLLFREHTHRALARLRRGGAGLAVLCLDLDRFKAVDDTLGHADRRRGVARRRRPSARLRARNRPGRAPGGRRVRRRPGRHRPTRRHDGVGPPSGRGLVGPVRRRGPPGRDGHQRRRRPGGRGRRRGAPRLGRAADMRRPGAAPGQGGRARHLGLLRSRHGRADAGPSPAGDGPAPGVGRGAVRGVLSAAGGGGRGRDQRLRSPAAPARQHDAPARRTGSGGTGRGGNDAPAPAGVLQPQRHRRRARRRAARGGPDLGRLAAQRRARRHHRRPALRRGLLRPGLGRPGGGRRARLRAHPVRLPPRRRRRAGTRDGADADVRGLVHGLRRRARSSRRGPASIGPSEPRSLAAEAVVAQSRDALRVRDGVPA